CRRSCRTRPQDPKEKTRAPNSSSRRRPGSTLQATEHRKCGSRRSPGRRAVDSARKHLIVLRMDARRGLFDEFAIAMALLTRLPVGVEAESEPGAIAASGWAFPLVGAGIGGLVALAFFVAELLGCGGAVTAALALLAG